jgi:hypothetical protein
MEGFDDLVRIMTETIERSGGPLTTKALVQEVNSVLVDRPLPESMITTFLMRNGDTFVESSPGEWSLRRWNPAEQGVSRITAEGNKNPWKQATGQIDEFRPIQQTLDDLAGSLLDQLVPPSQDRRILNRLSTFHIVRSSYKADTIPRDAVDSNRLVPPMLHAQTKNLSWRFPPMMQTTFFIRAEPGAQPMLNVRVLFGIASLIEYQEWRSSGVTQQIRRHYIANPEISIPETFARVHLNGSEYYLRESEGSEGLCRKTVQPIFYEAALTQIVSGDLNSIFDIPPVEPSTAVIKAYHEPSRRTLQCAQVDLVKPQGLDNQLPGDNPRWALVCLKTGSACARLTLEVEYHDDWQVFEVIVRLSNNLQTKSRRPPDHSTLLHSIIFPHLYVRLSNAQYILGSQQHEACLNEVRAGHSHLSQQDQFLADLSTQTNCVLTRSTKSANTVVVTPFGVYDTVRVNPVIGPCLEAICRDIDSFISSSTLSKSAKEYIRISSYRSDCLLAVIRALRRAFKGTSGPLEHLYAYQWKAIQNRIEMLASRNTKKTTVIRAPTGAGKTLVFFANAAINYLLTGHRAVMTFPTRILNEDMFKRLTRFVYALREEMRTIDPELVDRINGGILIGTSDPSYRAIVNPIVGRMMVQYDGCPKCQEEGKHRKVICQEVRGRLIGVCGNDECGHMITYMAGPREVEDVLPALTIATPDKLFYEATLGFPQRSLRFFGAPCIRCQCGYHISLLYKAGQVGDTVECKKCGSVIDKESAFKAGPKVLPKVVKSAPLYFVLDEVHSLYGITATLISYFLNLLREMAKSFGAEYEPTFETGTATIANEQKLIEAMTHQDMMMFPDDSEFFDYFAVQPDRVRYRSIVFMPVGKATRSTLTNAILSGYQGNRPGTEFEGCIGNQANGAYDFLLAYIPRKQNGYIIANEIRRVLDDRSIRFLSGDAPTAVLVTLLQDILDGHTNLLLANMVVSLGIDIPRLNNMLMLGIPKSMTEMVQTVGRTGRGQYPGHVVIHLQPSIPRDEFVYRHFHRVMGDVTGYFDSRPVAPVNTYVAELVFVNVLHALLSTRLADNYLNCFCDNAGRWLTTNFRILLGKMIKEILGRGGARDLQREVARVIQPKLRDAAIELSTRKGFLSDWARNNPDVLYSLRARADRVPVVIGQTVLHEEMKKGISADLRPVEEDPSQG